MINFVGDTRRVSETDSYNRNKTPAIVWADIQHSIAAVHAAVVES